MEGEVTGRQPETPRRDAAVICIVLNSSLLRDSPGTQRECRDYSVPSLVSSCWYNGNELFINPSLGFFWFHLPLRGLLGYKTTHLPVSLVTAGWSGRESSHVESRLYQLAPSAHTQKVQHNPFIMLSLRPALLSDRTIVVLLVSS